MAWFKIDDGFWSHPKTLMLSNDAIALWVRAGSWSSQQLTDGVIANHVLPLFAIDFAIADELVNAGYWHEVDGGYAFHDWEHYQPSAADTKLKRAELSRKRAEAGRKGAETRWQTDGNTDGKLLSGVDGKPMAPSRPVPSSTSNEVEREPRKRGTRIPESFEVTPEMVEWARKNAPLVNGQLSTTRFVNHFKAKTGRDATKLDWVATWRNWMLTDQEKAETRAKLTPTERASKTVRLATDLLEVGA